MVSGQLHSTIFGKCGLEDREIVEISGPSNSGKSLVLQQLMAHCLAPYEFGGRRWKVLFLNLSHKINWESLIKAISAELRAHSKGAKDTVPDDQVAAIARDCVNRVSFYNCFSCDELTLAFNQAPFLLATDPEVQLVVLDTLSELYWLDGTNTSQYRYYRHWQARLQRLCQESIVSAIYTVDSSFLRNTRRESVPVTKLRYQVQMAAGVGGFTLNGLPVSFKNGVRMGH
ncbi:hypothetical protein KR018_002511 [Drosophila ironensis]|nr:hypothetical protein KR018_002511 [Drosophila ironensis]